MTLIDDDEFRFNNITVTLLNTTTDTIHIGSYSEKTICRATVLIP